MYSRVFRAAIERLVVSTPASSSALTTCSACSCVSYIAITESAVGIALPRFLLHAQGFSSNSLAEKHCSEGDLSPQAKVSLGQNYAAFRRSQARPNPSFPPIDEKC
jgi:hypothetical protein